jgi:hypothetical protein
VAAIAWRHFFFYLQRANPVGSRNSSWLPSNAKRLVEAANLAFPNRSNFLTIRACGFLCSF